MVNLEKTIQKGIRCKIHYSETLKDGSEFKTTYGKEPVEIIIGKTHLIKGLEDSLIGMKEKEIKNATYSPEKAYGYHDPNLIAKLNKSEFPKNSIPPIGWVMKINNYTVTVKAIEDDIVTLDGNHPLVGQEVNFEIEILKIY